MSYFVPTASHLAEIEIRKSRSVAYAYPVSTRVEAMACVAELKEIYSDARHHCWAYRLGGDASASAGMSDDGEPSGSAGKPILNVITHQQLGNLLVVVVRFYGGIKLGVGGLTRAYSQATQAVLADLTVSLARTWVDQTVICDFAQEQVVRYQLNNLEGQIISVAYQQQVTLVIRLPEEQLAPWQAWLAQQQIESILHKL
ncbi:YigZ family protein [Thiomicrospira sp. ALE5]|uniref:YigZ family protein n=1 Tax=Thiomicrospira sp. ALE5 TaxID=748650 RepID=UPI0008F23109|nr:YigZ family protein [Thiomicrospira sp. ALE5]SFR49657.1 uncharacterized protein, YigZ family [Thiomicrospira sp. ALE5]